MADILAPNFNPGSRLAMFRQVRYGTDDLPGGSDGFDAHTIRSKYRLCLNSLKRFDMSAWTI